MRKMLFPSLAFLLGIGCAWGLCLLFAPPREGGQGAAPQAPPGPVELSAGKPTPCGVELVSGLHPDAGNVPPARLLGFARAAGEFSAAACEAALAEALKLSEPARYWAIQLLTLQWARSNPVAAADWIIKNVDGEARSLSMQGVLAEWMSRDLRGFAAWVSPHPELNHFVVSNMIRSDPALFGKWWEGRLNTTGSNVSEITPDMADMRDVRRVLEAASANTKYAGVEDTVAGEKWNRNGALGWNNLFEAAAARWHELDAAGCEAWLTSRSPLEQQAAWALINEQKKTTASPSTTAAPPSTETGGNHEISPADVPDHPPEGVSAAGLAAARTVEFSRSDLTTPPPPEAAPRFAQSWADWWQQDAPAAESHLKSCSWPEDLKFRARAKAYASKLPE